MRRTTGTYLAVAAVIAAAVAFGFLVTRASAKEEGYRGAGITPTNVGALTSEQTRVAAIPAKLQTMSSDLRPEEGAVHLLGGGLAFAWISEGRICWYAEVADGCLAHVPRPLDVVVGDPDVVGSGAAAQAYGIATDEVVSVSVELRDGRTVSGKVIDNFYEIELPAGVPPWSPLTVTAQLRDGTAFSEQV